MKLSLDENLTDRRVVAHLQRAGQTVVLPAEVGHAGASDAQHFVQALRHAAALLTRNYQDCIALHDLIHTACGHHPGLVLVSLANDPTRDMTPRSIAVAVARLAAAVP